MKLYIIISVLFFFAGLFGVGFSVILMMEGDKSALGMAVIIGATMFPFALAFFTKGRDPEHSVDWLQRDI